MKNHSDDKSIKDLLVELSNSIITLFSLAPVLLVLMFVLISSVIYSSAYLLEDYETLVNILVFASSIIFYYATKSYGQASIALTAGLLAAFTVNWDAKNATAFCISWVALGSFAFLVYGINLFAKDESLYKDAAITMDYKNSKTLEKDLRRIAYNATTPNLTPIKKGEVVRLLAYKGVKQDSIKTFLESISILCGATGISHTDATKIIYDISKISFNQKNLLGKSIEDYVCNFIRQNHITPEEFVLSFNASVNTFFSEDLQAKDYFSFLSDALEKRIPYNKISDFIREQAQK